MNPGSGLNLAEVQRQVDVWIGANGGYWDPLSLTLRLAEETGEVAREVNHRFGAKKKKASEGEHALEDELGDVLFIVVCLANQQGIDLSVAFERVLEKLRIRDAGRWTS